MRDNTEESESYASCGFVVGVAYVLLLIMAVVLGLSGSTAKVDLHFGHLLIGAGVIGIVSALWSMRGVRLRKGERVLRPTIDSFVVFGGVSIIAAPVYYMLASNIPGLLYISGAGVGAILLSVWLTRFVPKSYKMGN